jgi:hypothetical protein
VLDDHGVLASTRSQLEPAIIEYVGWFNNDRLICPATSGAMSVTPLHLKLH